LSENQISPKYRYIETLQTLGKPEISNGDYIKIGLIKTCDHLPKSPVGIDYRYHIMASIKLGK
jgi:hypothetical protein